MIILSSLADTNSGHQSYSLLYSCLLNIWGQTNIIFNINIYLGQDSKSRQSSCRPRTFNKHEYNIIYNNCITCITIGWIWWRRKRVRILGDYNVKLYNCIIKVPLSANRVPVGCAGTPTFIEALKLSPHGPCSHIQGH